MSGGSADYNREHGGPEGMDPDGVIKSNWNEIVDNFDDINLKESLLRGIYAYGFEKPSAIQQRAISPCIKGYDVIAQAELGTGKTATFAISILQQLDIEFKETQALVLASTFGSTDPKGNSGTWRLYGSNLSCLHWWNKCSK